MINEFRRFSPDPCVGGWVGSTPGSPKVLTRQTSGTPHDCSRSSPELYDSPLDLITDDLRHNSRIVGKPYLGITSRLPVIREQSRETPLIGCEGVTRPGCCPMKRCLVRDTDASKQVGKTAIGAKRVPERLYFEVSETIEPFLVSLF